MLEFNAKDLPIGPIVYIAWENDQCLYVGMSRYGMKRPFSNTTLVSNWHRITRLEVRSYSSTEEAALQEWKITKKLNPILNMQKPRDLTLMADDVDRPISRQSKWQSDRLSKGKCAICGSRPRHAGKRRCKGCLKRASEWAKDRKLQ